MNKKILVTGGSGFIGTNIIEFYEGKCDLLNLDILAPRNKAQNKYWEEVSLLDKEELTNAIFKFNPDIVFHMGARTDLDGKSLDDYAANTKGVENLIEATKEIGSIEKIIFASSRLVCEIGYTPKDEYDYKPSTIYGESKIIGEKIVREHKDLKKDWVIVRPTSLWGPWFDIPYKNFFDTINKNLYFHPKGLKIHKNFGYIGNCVHILDKLTNNKSLKGKTVYLSDFESLEVYDWANLISQQFHNKNGKSAPLFVLKMLATIGDVLKTVGYKNPPITNFRLNNLLTNMEYDTSNVEAVVGKLPFSLEEATIKTCNWYKKNK